MIKFLKMEDFKMIDKNKTAILVVDMLNDFVTGALKCDRGLAIVATNAKLLKGAREKNIPIIFCNDAHVKGIDHELQLWGEHAIAGTKGAEVIPELEVNEKDSIYKIETTTNKISIKINHKDNFTELSIKEENE